MKKEGFSLKELLAVAAIIAVIACLFVVPVPNIQNEAAAVTLYEVARGVETDLSHWPGGMGSRGINNMKQQVGTVTMDSSYPTGGETLDLSGTFKNAVLNCILAADRNYTFEYIHGTASDPATGKIKAYKARDTEADSAGDLQGYVVEYQAIGW